MDTTIEKAVLSNLEQRAERRESRRKAIMLGGAALAGIALTSKFANAQSTPTFTDSDYLNFALNLEFLEAQFYTLATAGVQITDSSVGISIDSGDGSVKGGTVTLKPGGVTATKFTTTVLGDYAAETALDEQNHVKVLQGALAKASVAMPNLDLYNSFNTLASAANLPGGTFDPFDGTELSFLLGAFIFEDVGVTAYNGAAALITDKKVVLPAAASILAVEAYHAGSIRTRIYAAGTAAQTASQSIANARATLSASVASNPQGNPDDFGVGTDSSGASTIVDADANAITFGRTPAQVKAITAPFFPNGLNGNIH